MRAAFEGHFTLPNSLSSVVRQLSIMAPVGQLTVDPPDIENLLALNPRIKPFANVVPTTVTKKVKKHWKRNDDKNEKLKSCG